MTASRRRNKCQAKSPSDAAARVPDNDSQAAGIKNHDEPPPPKKSCKSPPPSNTVPTVITQPNFSDEAFKTAARTNKIPAVLTQVETVSGEFPEPAKRSNAEVGVPAVPEDDSQAARTKNHDVPSPPKKSHNSPPPSKGTPKYISQDDVPEDATETAAKTNKVPAVPTQVLGTVSDEFSDTVPKSNAEAGNPKANTQQRKPPPIYSKAIPSLSEETEFVKALSLDVSTSFTQLMTKVYIVSKIIQSEPMPDFRKKSSTPSPTKKKKKKKESSLSMFGPIPHQTDVMVYFFVYKTDNGRGWGHKTCLYGCNVVNYVTIQKYMILYQEILVWCMEHVEYPPAPEKMDQGLWFYTKEFPVYDLSDSHRDSEEDSTDMSDNEKGSEYDLEDKGVVKVKKTASVNNIYHSIT
eukprot:jgi/Psemu1/23318/gm1.23318_g